jgi:hypothetical protein
MADDGHRGTDNSYSLRYHRHPGISMIVDTARSASSAVAAASATASGREASAVDTAHGKGTARKRRDHGHQQRQRRRPGGAARAVQGRPSELYEYDVSESSHDSPAVGMQLPPICADASAVARGARVTTARELRRTPQALVARTPRPTKGAVIGPRPRAPFAPALRRARILLDAARSSALRSGLRLSCAAA